MQPTGLPIESVLPDLARALGERGAAVLQAPPGAGKTTLVPLALLDAPWRGDRKILILEPRRLATRAAARRMAELLGERLGETVGYRIRRDATIGPRTRIEVVTEGILTRMVQGDPALEEVALVIFDEFHERSIHADLGLALVLQSRAILRPELRLLVMSATLDGAPIAALLGGAPVISSEGRAHPVVTRYLPRQPERWIEPAVAAAVRQALAETDGDILAFLPGQAEIRRTADLLRPDADGDAERRSGSGDRTWSVHPLYGTLSQAEQDAALRPAPAGRRKVVLATSIAETSLTIEGVRVVVDSGLARVPKFSPGSGMTRLATVRVSRASADQRRGRAGRTAPGVCYRLWAEQEDHHLLPRTTPEILEADLAPLALDLAAAGAEAADLQWLDPPPAAGLTEARNLLHELGALDGTGRITPHGRRLAELGTHPRLAHLLVRGAELGAGPIAADIAALLEERDFLRATAGAGDADLQLRLDLLASRETPAEYHGLRVDRGALHQVREGARAWRQAVRVLKSPAPSGEPPSPGLLLALAYPDRVGQRRPGQAGRFLLRNGQGVQTDSPALLRADYLVAADLDGDRRESRLWLGAPVGLAEIESLFGEQVEQLAVVEWDDRSGALVAVRRERLGALVLREAPLRDPDPALAIEAILAWLTRAGIGSLPWSEAAIALRQRLAFLYMALGAPWPDVSDAALVQALPVWLGPELGGVRRRADLARLDLGAALLGLLGWEERRQLDLLAPTHLPVPTGSRIALNYQDPANPALAVRLQEVFGLTETPRIAGGRVAVTMQLLSPGHRPVQVTQDLAGFWQSSYFDVKREMKGRYPRHYWPDNPLEAEPTRRAKPRGT